MASINLHTQLTSIMEILTKAAVAEIIKLVDEGYAVLRFQLYRCQNEKDALKRELRLAERELRVARSGRASESSSENITVGLQVYSGFSVTAEGGVHLGGKPLFEQQLSEKACDPQCAPVEMEQVSQCTLTEDGKKPDTEPTPVGDPEELSEQHRCGHSDEELSGLEVVVKAEQEEDVTPTLNQTGCDRSAEQTRHNNQDSESVMYERDNQLWTYFAQGNSNVESNDPICSNATEQCSLSLSVHSPLHHTPATMEASGSTLPSSEASYAEEFDKMDEMPSVCSEELRSEAIHTQQGQYRERLAHTVERENQTLLPQQQQHGPSVKHRRGSESPAQPHSGSHHREIAVLKRNLQLKESELRSARRLQERFSQMRSTAVPVCRVRVSDRAKGFCVPGEEIFDHEPNLTARGEEPKAVEEVELPLQSSTMRDQTVNMELVQAKPVHIKQEKLGEEICQTDPQSAPSTEGQVTELTTEEDGKKPDTEPTPVGDPEELSDQERHGHVDEELSGLEFVVKAEPVEEHVAQRLSLTESELGAGRLNNHDSECVMYERGNQMWTSFTQRNSDKESDDTDCSNSTFKQCLQSQAVHIPLQSSTLSMEVSESTQPSFGASYAEEFDKMGEKPSVCSVELRSVDIHSQQGQYRDILGSQTKEDLMIRRQEQQPQFANSNPEVLDRGRYVPLDRIKTRGKAPRKASTGQKRFSCLQCGKSFTTRFYLKIHRRIHTGERPFTCAQCGKGFYCTSHLTSHQRSHTGEKPYSCDECGNSYSHLNSLKLHYRVHTEETELSFT
ncbi:hypothetical protein GJAV_G00094000 [Gymnothorax javanicus]|nr:hypothetical protein GJAV_G00094000 [Gymnothorax javanicus]